MAVEDRRVAQSRRGHGDVVVHPVDGPGPGEVSDPRPLVAVFGVHGNIARVGTMSISECVGIVFGGLAIFGLNGILTATVIGLEQDAGFPRAARAAFGLSTTADGALLALAPVFAIAVESRIVALPLLGVTAVLAGRSAHASLRSRHLGHHDRLTQLPDRVMFDRQLAEVLGDGEHNVETGSFALVVMDLDRFQWVNDRFGHQIGDLVLVSFAERLESVLPSAGRPARLGGDEFAAIIRTTDTSA